MSIVVTGGAGFIGSCILRALNDAGTEDIIVVDHIGDTEKWINIRNKRYREYVHKDQFRERLERGEYEGITAVIHMGACSSTTERDFDYLWSNNVEYSKMLWRYCTDKQIPFLYASSAATYGDGSLGFDDKMDIRLLEPCNGYGYSKQAFDLWAEKQEAPPQHVGFKFFNVYGPNEYCKGSMASMAYHGYRQIMEKGRVGLFRSYRPGCPDGGQTRDFIYVKDICDVVMFMMEHREINGIFNVGSGGGYTFYELAEAVFHALHMETAVEYIDMPMQLRGKYQYYTKADISKLREAGYTKKFYDIKAGVEDYVTSYLEKGFAIY